MSCRILGLMKDNFKGKRGKKEIKDPRSILRKNKCK